MGKTPTVLTIVFILTLVSAVTTRVATWELSDDYHVTRTVLLYVD